MKKWICRLFGCDGKGGSMTAEEEARLWAALNELRRILKRAKNESK